MTGPQTKQKSPKTQTFGIRLTEDEKRKLKRRAGEMAMGTYIKAVLFADGVKHRRRAARSPIKDHQTLAKVLACLGSSGLRESLDRLSRAAETSVLQWDEEAPLAVQKACEDIVTMRLLLMKALGFRIDEAELSQSLRQTFTQAAQVDPDISGEED
ncbi:conserved hypothetical protein [Roseibium sp. TrichSKD4]|uniref:hypothetical protein n=1 Tax=Roseibium sp. TrichSKD4 TaxID=744980 RepID=UPI0001E56AA5|nr:hypothetical protein [Roseibium sp. TrichSKD4]EFO31129.1 conserved hypothetical protein [Roseibium sp. TrichSKD4]